MNAILIFLHKVSKYLNQIVKLTKSRRLKWAEHVARMEGDRHAFKVLTGKNQIKKFLGSLGADRGGGF